MRARATCTPDASSRLKILSKVSFTVKAHVGIAIPVLNADNHVADDRNARTVAQELLVGGLCVILFRLYELMVKVKIVFQPSLQLTSCK